MAKRNLKKDPFISREAEKYSHPIPSREFILAHITTESKVLSFQAVCQLVGVSSERDQEALRRRLGAMCRDGQLLRAGRDKYELIKSGSLITGRVQGHRDGHGFFAPEEGGKDFFIPPREMRCVFDGDRARAQVRQTRFRGRPEIIIIEVIERQHTQVVGRYFCESGMSFVEPENQRITQDIKIEEQARNDAQPGQVVLVDIIQPPSKRAHALGRVVKILGDHMAPGMETEMAIYAHNLPNHWPSAVDKALKSFKAQPKKSDYRHRKDLRELPFVTIDGEDAKDFDDAVYCEKRPRGGWRLLVAIADVSHYVKPGSALDQEALLRGNSVYFPQRVIPMLPEALSNGLCSLKPHEDRLVMVCDMSISPKGQVSESDFYPAVIHSAARLTYTQMADIVQAETPAARRQHQPLLEHLDELYKLYFALAKYRASLGTLYFEIPAPYFVFDEQQKIKQLLPVIRNDAHKIIEECMLCANVAAAQFILVNDYCGIFRVHLGPKKDRLPDFTQFLNELGLKLSNKEEATSSDFARLLRDIADRPDAHLIQMMMLRTLARAYYATENTGHFGLAFDAYAHFTSPIRRFPDLMVHRIIKQILAGKKQKKDQFADNQRVAEHCSMTERRAEEATREVISWLKCEFMMDKIGQEFDAIISGVTGFGLFVELRGIFVEGLLHITALDNDYYCFDTVHHRLMGERTGKIYAMGDPLRVKVVRVNLEGKQIDFELVKSTKAPRKKKRVRR
jgi:ribonuclease R